MNILLTPEYLCRTTLAALLNAIRPGKKIRFEIRDTQTIFSSPFFIAVQRFLQILGDLRTVASPGVPAVSPTEEISGFGCRL